MGRLAGTGKAKTPMRVGRVMVVSIGEQRVRKHRSRFPFGSGTLTESKPGGCRAEILSCDAIAIKRDISTAGIV